MTLVIPPYLLNAIHAALGRSMECEDRREEGPVVQHELRILLAEDNPVNQLVATRILEKQGYALEVASNGHEAIEILARQPFDLVLMDVQMPEMDGIETTKAIREKEARSDEHIPIVAMTAHAMKGDKERCLDAGMDDYVAKPIKAEDLLEVIHRFLGDSEAPGEDEGMKNAA